MLNKSILMFVTTLAACSAAPDDNQPIGTSSSAVSANVTPADYQKGWAIPVPPAKSTTEAINTYAARARAFIQAQACDMNSEFRRDLNFPGEHWSHDALAMMAFDGNCTDASGKAETPADRANAVSAKLAHFVTNGQNLGTTIDDDTLKRFGYTRKGELESALKDLMPILFLYRSRLSAAAYGQMLSILQQWDAGPVRSFDWIDIYPEDLDLAAWIPLAVDRDILSPVGWILTAIASIEIDRFSIAETENHKLMIFSVRYLANDLLYAANKDPQYDNTKNGMKSWWLNRLASILKHDFKEYNAKPYSRYSLDAIEDLAELAHDPDVSTAARAVLDFSAAKYAVSSSLMRRESPYRRKASYDSPDYFTGALDKSMDEWACRFALYAGTTDLLPMHLGVQGTVLPDACEYVSRQAMGSYRVPPMIVELALNKGTQTYFQTFSGGTNDESQASGNIEIYDNEGPFMIAGGGAPNDTGSIAVLRLRVGEDKHFTDRQADDFGITVPTVILPNTTYPVPTDPRNVVDRGKTVSIQSGLCVAPGFACGLFPTVPPELANAMDPNNPSQPLTVTNGKWKFVDFKGFYVAVYGDQFGAYPFGFFESVSAGKVGTFSDFQAKVLAANPNAPAKMSGGPYVASQPIIDVNYNSALGGPIVAHYDLNTTRTYPVSQDRGLTLPSANADSWPMAWGAIDAQHDGEVKVNVYGPSAWLYPCDLNLTTPGNPKRSSCDLLPGDYTPPPPQPHSSINWAVNLTPTDRTFPTSALSVGGEGSLDEYICRVNTAQGPLMGHYDRQHGCVTPVSVSNPSVAARANSSYDVLTYDGNNVYNSPIWLPPSDDYVAQYVYTAGNDPSGGPIQVCRVMTPALHQLPGMLTRSGCWVGENGVMTRYNEFEVFVLRPIPAPTTNANGFSLTMPPQVSLYQNGTTGFWSKSKGQPGTVTFTTASPLPGDLKLTVTGQPAHIEDGSIGLNFSATKATPIGLYPVNIIAASNGVTAQYNMVVEVDSCVPATQCNAQCGVIADGCGGTLDCGACKAPTPQSKCEDSGGLWVQGHCKTCGTPKQCCLADGNSWINNRCQ